MSHSISIQPEFDPALLDEFALGSEPMVRKLLHTMLDDEHELYVFLKGTGVHFVTEILELDWERGLLWLGTPYDKELAQGCNVYCEFTIVSFPDGVKVQFSGTGMVPDTFEAAAALRIAMPTSLVRLQRRNYFRVVADTELNRQVRLSVPGLQTLHGLLDISLAGVGMLVGKQPDLESGHVFRNAQLTLPDGEGSMLVNLEVRNIKPQVDEPEQLQVGCEMTLLERGAERRLQRFLLATERRQRSAQHA
ncbi:flagellar brake protein [Limnobacter humi]|uniref:Flagellar brake protein n=1 Tax=Limnobacter humi TaxID=1778671 RepID=A0ABT1WJQ6_9BURK|nr:flagellar brake protein [Limnobacter humi]MCQ8897752.1 flagellar brake protein [Limnobacter humi]